MEQAILTNVIYPNLASATKTEKVVVPLNRFSNSSNLEEKCTMTGSRAVNVTRKWSLSITIPLSLPVTVHAGIPLIKEAEEKNEWSLSKASPTPYLNRHRKQRLGRLYVHLEYVFLVKLQCMKTKSARNMRVIWSCISTMARSTVTRRRKYMKDST
ncbi:hypothetical protein DPMN_135683 [Dreissena polymorpha]|uniref:Uncharacterized protein n=1 Tax=Dreissena polymorpha TaxID=45954 RepID=A0A9D4G2E0_DREPO|nr:hypothetical protein DPMN_135683 [Dreissena polymorpha]